MRSLKAILYLFACIILVSGLIACGGGGGNDSNNGNNNQINLTSRQDQAGDSYTYSTSMEVTYSNGQTASLSHTDVNTISQVNTIPSKYSYSGTISGPYLLDTGTEDGIIDSFEYSTIDGTEIIDDNLETFTRIDDTTVTGSGDPDNVSIGDTFIYSENAKLFDTINGTQVGTRLIQADFIVEKTEQISIGANTYNCVKINFQMDETLTKNSITDTFNSTGSSWFELTSGVMIRIAINMSGTVNRYGLTFIATSSTELQNYNLVQTSSAKSAMSVSTGNISLDTISKAIINEFNTSLSNL